MNDVPAAVSGDGSIIVGQSWEGPFIWSSRSGFRPLEPLLAALAPEAADGWLIDTVSDISDYGWTLVGSGINPTGDREAWKIRLGEHDWSRVCSAAAHCGDGLQCTTDTCGSDGFCSNTNIPGCVDLCPADPQKLAPGAWRLRRSRHR